MASEWKIARVGELGKIITGKTPKTSEDRYYGGSIPFISPSDDMTVKHISSTKKTLTEDGLQTVRNCYLPKGTVCVTCIGTVGNVVITSEPSVTNQQINSIVVDESKYDVDFVYYLMIILGERLAFDAQFSSVVPIVNKTAFSNYIVSVPELATQKRIASILAAIDDKIELNNKINDNLAA